MTDGIISRLGADEEGMFDFVNSLSRYVMDFTSNSLPSQIKTDKFRQKRILIQDKLIEIRYHSQAFSCHNVFCESHSL